MRQTFCGTISVMQPNNMMPQPGGYPQMPLAASQKRGHSLSLIIALVVTVLLLIGASVFGFWAFAGLQDYKTNTDQKIAAAADEAQRQIIAEKDKEFIEKEKSPHKEYKGPSKFGSVHIKYPKTWAAFVTESEKSGTPIEGYFHPVFVPGIQSGVNFALRIQVSNQSYDQELKQFDARVKAGKVKVSAFKAAKVPGVLGARVEGEIEAGQKAGMVLFPVRDKTLKIYTQSDQFLGDFNNTILPNLVFVP